MTALRRAGCWAALLLGVWSAPAASQSPYGGNPEAGHRLRVGDAWIYYERYGAGRPVVLLHGGLFGSIGEFAGLIQDLRRDHTVIAIALRGHGESEMGSGPLTNQRIADDAAAVIRRESLGPVDVVGFSTGAIAAYRLAIAHPELLRSLVAIGGPIAASGYTDGGLEEMRSYDSPAEVERRYPALVRARRRAYADPRDWDRLVRAFGTMAREEPDLPAAAIRAIAQPSLIVAGDRDEYGRTEHFVDIYRLLPRGSLAIVPGCGHVVLACRPALMRDLVRGFLDSRAGR